MFSSLSIPTTARRGITEPVFLQLIPDEPFYLYVHV